LIEVGGAQPPGVWEVRLSEYVPDVFAENEVAWIV
jgi:hypothetical protein